MESVLVENLRICITAYAAAMHLREGAVCNLATGDYRFLSRVSNSGTFTVRKYDEAMKWLSVNWPANLPWPEAILRPSSLVLASAQ